MPIKTRHAALTGTTSLLCLTIGTAALWAAAADAAPPPKQMHEKVLYSFTAGAEGEYPYGVTLTKDHLVGTTYEGGSGVGGTVYSLTKAGQITILHSFISNSEDASNSTSGVVVDKLGNIYGTTIYGGPKPYNTGTVFKIGPDGNEIFVYDFPGCASGGQPLYGHLILSHDVLYGVTNTGENCNFDGGSVFSVTTAGAVTTMYSFYGANPATAGDNPEGALLSLNGSLFGTTEYGGAASVGTIFSISKKGAKAHEKVLYAFKGPTDGSYPTGGVIVGKDGRFYGITELGGAGGEGTVFAVDASGKETTIHSFGSGGADGGYPEFGMIQDAQGNMFGTTAGGGTAGEGTIFEVAVDGTTTTLYSFGTGKNAATDGSGPSSALVVDRDGNFYGTTEQGGTDGYGTVYKFTR